MSAFSIIVAFDQNRGIGRDGDLPWHLPPDLKHFKDVTTAVSSAENPNAVIMGRKTWESIPEKFRPLPDRLNIVISRNKDYLLPEGVVLCVDLDTALSAANARGCEKIFVIGGEQVFSTALKHPECKTLYATHLEDEFKCDAFFPEAPGFACVEKSEHFDHQGLPYHFAVYRR